MTPEGARPEGMPSFGNRPTASRLRETLDAYSRTVDELAAAVAEAG